MVGVVAEAGGGIDQMDAGDRTRGAVKDKGGIQEVEAPPGVRFPALYRYRKLKGRRGKKRRMDKAPSWILILSKCALNCKRRRMRPRPYKRMTNPNECRQTQQHQQHQ